MRKSFQVLRVVAGNRFSILVEGSSFMDSQNDFIVLKTKYEEKQEIRRFQVRIKDFTFNALDEMITQKYNQSNWAKHFTIKVWIQSP